MVVVIAACRSPYQPPKPDAPTADMLTIDTTIYTFDTFFMQLNVREIPTQAGDGPYEYSFSVAYLPPNTRGGFTEAHGVGSFDNTFYLLPYNAPEGNYNTRIVTTSSDNNTPSSLPINITIKHCTDSAFYSIVNNHIAKEGFTVRDLNTGKITTTRPITFQHPTVDYKQIAIYNLKLDTGEVYSSNISDLGDGILVHTTIDHSTTGIFVIDSIVRHSPMSTITYLIEGQGKLNYEESIMTIDYTVQTFDFINWIYIGTKRHYRIEGPIKF